MYGNLCEPWTPYYCVDTSEFDPELLDFSLQFASEFLWGATGRRFGNCPITIRPCRRDCPEIPQDLRFFDGSVRTGTSWGWPYPTLLDGVWVNLACGVCPSNCSCSSVSEILLPAKVSEIIDVVVDGESLPVTGYQLYDGQRLVRVDDEWPRCQDWEVAVGPGAWSIEASFGADVPAGGAMAVGALTIEIAKMCQGEPCNVPPSVQRVIRQGVTMETMNPSEQLDAGFTGIHLVDMFIRRWNPEGIQDRARAHSIDVPVPRIQS